MLKVPHPINGISLFSSPSKSSRRFRLFGLALALFFIGGSLSQASTAFYSSVYDAENGEGKVVAIDEAGNYTTYASGFEQPEGLAQDSHGNVFVIDGADLWKITSANTKTLWATKPTAYNSWGLAIDAFDNIYVTGSASSPTYAEQIYQYNSAGVLQQTWNVATTPVGLTIGTDGYLYSADIFADQVSRYNPTTGAASTYYDFTGAYAGFQIFDLVFNEQGELFVSGALYDALLDKTVQQVLKISADLSTISVVVNDGLSDVRGITLDGAGNLYMANWTCGCPGTENAIMSQTGTDAEVFSDQGEYSPNFIISAVPEPSSTLLLLIGLGALGFQKAGKSRSS